MSNRLFTGNTIYFVVILNFAKRRRRQRMQNKRQRCVWVHNTRRWETECWRILHTCAQTMGPTAMTTDYSNTSEFHKRSLRLCAYSIDTWMLQYRGKLTYFYRVYEATGLHRPARQRRVINQNKSDDWSTAQHIWRVVSRRKIAPEAIGRGTARVSRRNKKRLLIGQVRYRAGSRRENRLV